MAQPDAVSQFPTVGRWIVTALPRGWIYVADFGIRQMSMDPVAVTANVCLGQETLQPDSPLAEYIEKQKTLVEGHLKEAKFAGPRPIAFADAQEAQLLFVRHAVDQVGTMLHAQTFARFGNWLGIVTLTTLEAQLSAVRPDYDAFVKGLHISPPDPNDSAARDQQLEPARESA